jgi:segregation and condensation protein B
MSDATQFLEYKSIVEALLFASDSPLNIAEIGRIIDGVDESEIKKCIYELNAEYEKTPHSFQILEVADGFQFSTRVDYAKWIKRLYRGRIPTRLTQPSLECLAIIAYKQPVSRSEVEAVRGVNVDGVIRTLLDRNLIRIAGRGDGVGRPILYATTTDFLRYFGLNKLTDLPRVDELNDLLKDNNINLQQELAEESDHSLFPSPETPIFERDETE